MGQHKPKRDDEEEEEPCEVRNQRRLHVLYTRRTRKRQIFMDELLEYRKKRDEELFKTITDSIGPRWYQALSELQRGALDSLRAAIVQDLLENRPIRTAKVIHGLGVYPRPKNSDLMTCIYLGRKDPKEMLALMYSTMFGYTMEGKRESYTLNAKLILSGILYLGLDNIIELLKERFRPDEVKEEKKPKKRVKRKIHYASPYLEEFVAGCYERPKSKPFKPLPLPILDDLNAPYEEVPLPIKKPPPPPPPKVVKPTLSKSMCDKYAGIYRVEPHCPLEEPSIRKTLRGRQNRKLQRSKTHLHGSPKRAFGMGAGVKTKAPHNKKPTPPNTGSNNAQFAISGVVDINGKSYYILSNVCILPAQGELIHGGYANVQNKNININCGFRGKLPEPLPEPCDCLKKWEDTVFQHIRGSKCYCGHHYDFGHDEAVQPEELPYFSKPTRNHPMIFNYDTIYNFDKKDLQVQKEFKRLWETDSTLRVGPVVKVTKKKKVRTSNTCLGSRPRPEDYLRCALRFMRSVNIAARLPDLHLVPELREWMRSRIHGPLTPRAKTAFLLKSNSYWACIESRCKRGLGQVYTPRSAFSGGATNWLHKQKLLDAYRCFTHNFKVRMFRARSQVTNLFWRSMFQAEMPDKKFREIYFSYLWSTLEDLNIIEPFSTSLAVARYNVLSKNPYICLPKGAENINI